MGRVKVKFLLILNIFLYSNSNSRVDFNSFLIYSNVIIHSSELFKSMLMPEFENYFCIEQMY